MQELFTVNSFVEDKEIKREQEIFNQLNNEQKQKYLDSLDIELIDFDMLEVIYN